MMASVSMVWSVTTASPDLGSFLGERPTSLSSVNKDTRSGNATISFLRIRTKKSFCNNLTILIFIIVYWIDHHWGVGGARHGLLGV